MSERRDQDAPGDPFISAAYRGLSQETTSERLDRKILKDAAAAVPSKRASPLMSLKPWAWAATIALTVTLVLELQQSDAPQVLINEDAAMPIEASADSNGAIRNEAVDNAIADKDVAADSAKKVEAAAEPRSFAPSAVAPATVQQAERMAEQQKVNDLRREDYTPARLSEQHTRMKRDDRRFCDAAATADASSWYQCVLDLEEAGQFEQAEVERTRLFSNYPDFEVR